MGNDESKKLPDDKTPEERKAIDIHGLTEGEVDADAPTVFMQRAINPEELNTVSPDSEETKIIRAITPEEAKKLMSEEELYRIIDEVGQAGALPMDNLPSAVKKDDPEKKKD